jgi:hypothetical protein
MGVGSVLMTRSEDLRVATITPSMRSTVHNS